MSIVNSIETVRDWLTAEVCPLVKLKLPDDNATDASYPYKLGKPGRVLAFRTIEGQDAPEHRRADPVGLRADRSGRR